MSVNIAEVVTIIETSTTAEQNITSRRPSARRTLSDDEIFLAKPTFSERLVRYLMVGVYLCGLCGVGFCLSIYHIFFWDSTMPPVYKAKKPIMG